MLFVYWKPDFWVRPWQILRWRTTTSAPQCRTARPNAGLCIPTYVLGIRPNTSESTGPIDILTPSLERSQSRSFNSLIQSMLVLLANPFFNSCRLNFFQTESACSSSSSLSCCISSLGKGLSALCTIQLQGWPLLLEETLPLQNSDNYETCFFKIRFLGRTLLLRKSTLKVSKGWPHLKIWPDSQIPTDTLYTRTSINSSWVTFNDLLF